MVVVFICLMIQRDLIRKLWGLHYSGVIHGNLNPQNVLVFEGECMLTSIINDGKYFISFKILLRSCANVHDISPVLVMYQSHKHLSPRAVVIS